MIALLAAFGCGLLFAIGLAISGMTQTSKVLGFLDFFGSWDPSLMFVMGGAVLTYAVGYRLILRRSTPLLGPAFVLPDRSQITPSLVVGAAIFGIGWGLSGYCPGPAIVSLASGTREVLVFVPFMAAGMLLHRAFEAWSSTRRPAPATPAGDMCG